MTPEMIDIINHGIHDTEMLLVNIMLLGTAGFGVLYLGKITVSKIARAIFYKWIY